MTLGDLRAGLAVSTQALASALGIGASALAKLEAMPLARVSVGALVGYAAGLGARVEVVFGDGRMVEVKP